MTIPQGRCGYVVKKTVNKSHWVKHVAPKYNTEEYNNNLRCISEIYLFRDVGNRWQSFAYKIINSGLVKSSIFSHP